ncbi:DUF1900-domain-containing protein [Linderina pennispora]|uniref:DUF1900-domain-containing protein n=1 Tax=Linderina pennispora TaxID=61395 RepID=A0A1Y1WHT1_9FUNG|nr:DUF1900-domain-containing protein [Linderina pennispora]ORX72684.1 DUF1900-domain-containing protein [Linderina pennispora]
MYSFVRPSKYRHVYGTASKREGCYESLRISLGAWDTNFVTANPKYVAANWDAGGGGAFCVVPLSQVGKLRGDFPLFSAHAGAVLDTAFSPFDDDIIASVAEDHTAMIWRVPEDLLEREENVTTPLLKLPGHGRKVGHVAWNPVAENVLAVSSSDYTVKIWDVASGQARQTLQGFKDNILSMDWSHDGVLIAATCRDKKLRVFDARSGELVQEGVSHQGVKGSRVTWLGREPRLVTTGFARSSDREVYLWDATNLEKPLLKQDIDLSSGMLMPFYDASTNMLYVAGKGDGNIRYYEYDSDKLHFLSEYQSPEPQRGLGVMPKRGVDVKTCEVMRFYKVASNSLIEPISFRVPRKSEAFQNDIYPPAHAGRAAMTADEYFAGQTAEPVTVDMETIFNNGPLIAGGSAPQIATSAAPAPAVAAPSPLAQSTPSRSPAPSASPAPPPAPVAAAPVAAPVATSRGQLTPGTRSPSPAVAASSSAELDRLRAENEQLQKQLADAASQHSASSKAGAEQASALSAQLDEVRGELTQTQSAVAALQKREEDALARLAQAEQLAAESQRAASDLQDRLDKAITVDQLTAVEEKLQAGRATGRESARGSGRGQ